MFLWSLLSTSDSFANLSIPPLAGWLSVATLVVSSALYRRTPLQWTSWAAIVVYGMLVLAIGSTIALTDGVNSPYLALWMVVAVLSAMFDLWGIGVLLALINGFLVYSFVADGTISQSEIVIAIIAGEMPLVISWIFWVSNKGQDHANDPEVMNLNSKIEKESVKTSTIIEAIGDGVIVVKQTGEITAINPAAQKMTGWNDNDALKLHFSSVLKVEDEEGVELIDDRNPVKKTLNTSQQTRANDVRIVTKAGRKIDADFVVSPTDGSDLGEGAIAIFRDVTKERAEEKEQAEFISTASHEMRTPVASIEGYLGLALNPSTATIDEKAREYIQKAQESAKHLGGLFQDLLDISRADDGKLNSRPVVIDAVSFSRDILDGFKMSAKEKGLQLIFRPDGNKGTVGSAVITPVLYTHVDRSHLREVLDNLIENAVKYTEEGSVSIDVTGSNESIRFSIKDSGLGIPEEDLSHLFQKFYRVDSSQTREIGGTGLGLYLCRRLVESMQGRIWVESSSGEGSTFFVEIPRIDHQKASLLKEREKVETPETPVPMPTIPPSLSTPQPQTVAKPATQTPPPTPAPTPTPAPQPQQTPTPPTPAPTHTQQPRPTSPPQQQQQQAQPASTPVQPQATPTTPTGSRRPTSQPNPSQPVSLPTVQAQTPPQSPQPIQLPNLNSRSPQSTPHQTQPPIHRPQQPTHATTPTPAIPTAATQHVHASSTQHTTQQTNPHQAPKPAPATPGPVQQQQSQMQTPQAPPSQNQPTQQTVAQTNIQQPQPQSDQGTQAYMNHSDIRRANVPLSELERDPSRFISPRQ